MAMSKNADGKVSAENISGTKLPRKAGLVNETTGKALGTRPVKPSRSIVNFANRGQRGR
jgi:hypothetical protein